MSFAGQPPTFPFARADVSLAMVRSRIRSRSNSAKALARCRRVGALPQQSEPDIPAVQVADEGDQMGQRLGRSVQPPYAQDIAELEEGESRLKLRPIDLRPRCHVPEDPPISGLD
jgi:hypothetical protein